jgi:hypothetical protein
LADRLRRDEVLPRTARRQGNLHRHFDRQHGTTGNTSAVLTLQKDGNLVIYGTYGKALWKSGTDN